MDNTPMAKALLSVALSRCGNEMSSLGAKA